MKVTLTALLSTVVAAGALVALNAGPSSAACAAPLIELEPDSTRAGHHITVRGEGFASECNDVNPDPDDENPPVQDIVITFEQNGESRRLATVDADAQDYSFSVVLRVPDDASQGDALIRADPAGESSSAEEQLTVTDRRATQRVFGANRVETAVAVSRRAFPDTASVVYLARDDVLVDAVVGGTLTDGPVLLVPACAGVPPIVQQEIERLRPGMIATLGGSAAVCDQTLEQAAAG